MVLCLVLYFVIFVVLPWPPNAVSHSRAGFNSGLIPDSIVDICWSEHGHGHGFKRVTR